MPKVLILDQSKSLRNALRERLEVEAITTESAETAEQAIDLVGRIPFDVIISENEARLPDTENTPYIVISRDATVDSAIEALRNGAADYLPAPVDMNRLMATIRGICSSSDQAPTPTRVAPRRAKPTAATQDIMVGTSPQIQRLHQIIDKVAPCDARVLITGENGTGKELVARRLHARSLRATMPFVEVNCAAIPSELIESELFGHERGAFTSAVKQRKGKFEQANGGTLFMDEIGDMSLSAQAKVLRALQESRISRVGSDRDVEVDVRIIAATNKNLREEIAKGNFREDLYHRLGVVIVHVPPLREHAEDIPSLVSHFMDQVCNEYKIPAKQIEKAAVAKLQKKPWTGNVRELRNVIERLVVLSDGAITAADVDAYCE